jgi:hypothetical protein
MNRYLMAVIAALCLPVLAVVVFASGVAHAADFCFNTSSYQNQATPDDPNILVVGQKFKVPRPGKCSAIVGFDWASSNYTFARPASGTACRATDGSRMEVGIMIHSAAGTGIGTDSEIHVSLNLPYPALASGEAYVRRDLPFLGEHRFNGNAGPCGNYPFP